MNVPQQRAAAPAAGATPPASPATPMASGASAPQVAAPSTVRVVSPAPSAPAAASPSAPAAAPAGPGPGAPSPGGAGAFGAQQPAIKASKRKPLLIGLGALVVLGGIGYGAYYAIALAHFESTDNAYVQGNLVQVTPQVGGTVLQVLVDDTDTVKAGQVLVRLDPADARLALERANSMLAQTQRQVRTLYTNGGSADANVKLRDAEIAKAQADVSRAQEDVNRRRPLVATGAVSGEEMKHAETSLLQAQSALAGARSARAAAVEAVGGTRALTEGFTPDNQPNVLNAQAAVHEAQLALDRTELRAPVDGQVARRSVQIGQRIAPGAPLMTVVPLSQVWVEANFKEVQLRKMRIGQTAEITADLYGGKIKYDGKIVGVGAGTGSAFALLPAQNATGNWIKVVQRVPVRVQLDAKQVQEHPLRVGLSMDVKVDVAESSGPGLMDGAGQGGPAAPTQSGSNAAPASRDASSGAVASAATAETAATLVAAAPIVVASAQGGASKRTSTAPVAQRSAARNAPTATTASGHASSRR